MGVGFRMRAVELFTVARFMSAIARQAGRLPEIGVVSPDFLRSEALGFNPLADLPVERIGVRFTDGQVVDYTVQVTLRQAQGPSETITVWARNLDRAIELEWKHALSGAEGTGDAREFDLRNYAIDFASLDEVNSTDDSTYRVEMLTPAQFHFATSMGGIDFRPEMLRRRAGAASNDDGAEGLAA